MKTLYVEGDTLLHRLSPRIKLGGLALISFLLFLVHAVVPLAVAAFAGLATYASLRLGWRQSWQQLQVILFTIFVVVAFTTAFNAPFEGLLVFLRLIALTFFAATITATTSTGDFIDTVTAGFRPLELIGLVKAADIGLAIGLVIRFVPEVLYRYRAIREAHYARGLKTKPLNIAIPLIIMTLKSADEIAAAIDARGIRGQN